MTYPEYNEPSRYNIRGNLKRHRHLTCRKLQYLYREDELDALVHPFHYPQYRRVHTATIKYGAIHAANKAIADACIPRKMHRWSAYEDKFLRDTYMFITDNTTALALNLPVNIVLSRRRTLGLIKLPKTDLKVIVWCNRDNFEKDLQDQRLTAARPDIEW